jgi:predicted Ser/Thr protein kinase|tara:strand:- start:806 stop:1189 length:384 start_codon:yes stop_codon:yes gene_type:complete
MLDKVKKALGMKPEQVKKLTAEEQRRAILEKEKAQATKDKKPWVAVLDTQVNPENIKNGFFELDWNNEFIEQLIDAGYSGEQPEHIVDQWFRTIATQMLEQDGQQTDRGMGYIETSKADDNGKAEVK